MLSQCDHSCRYQATTVYIRYCFRTHRAAFLSRYIVFKKSRGDLDTSTAPSKKETASLAGFTRIFATDDSSITALVRDCSARVGSTKGGSSQGSSNQARTRQAENVIGMSC